MHFVTNLKDMFHWAPPKFRNTERVGWVERSLRNLNWALKWDCDNEMKKGKSISKGAANGKGTDYS